MWARIPIAGFGCRSGGPGGIRTPMPFGPGLQPGEPPLLNRPTVAARRIENAVPWWIRPPIDDAWSRRRDSNPEPAVYKTAALPIELRRHDGQGHTADDPFRRRGMIGPRGPTGQARGVRVALGFGGFAAGWGFGPPGRRSRRFPSSDPRWGRARS